MDGAEGIVTTGTVTSPANLRTDVSVASPDPTFWATVDGCVIVGVCVNEIAISHFKVYIYNYSNIQLVVKPGSYYAGQRGVTAPFYYCVII